MINKKGMGFVPILILILIGIFAGGGVLWFVNSRTAPVQQTGVGGGIAPANNAQLIGSGQASPGVSVNSPGTIILTLQDALQPGTYTGGTINIAVWNGTAIGAYNGAGAYTTALIGTRYDAIITNSTAYHSAFIRNHLVTNSPDGLAGLAYGNATGATLTVFTDTSGLVLTNSATGGAQNQSATIAGALYNHKIVIQGQTYKSTSDMRCVAELSSRTNTSTIALSGTSVTPSNYAGTSVVNGQTQPGASGWTTMPRFYSPGSSAITTWFDVPRVDNNNQATLLLAVQSVGTQKLSGDTGKFTCFGKEFFQDAYTGQVAYDIVDSQGNAKYMWSQTYSWQYI